MLSDILGINLSFYLHKALILLPLLLSVSVSNFLYYSIIILTLNFKLFIEKKIKKRTLAF
jgi:hypothetical protein